MNTDAVLRAYRDESLVKAVELEVALSAAQREVLNSALSAPGMVAALHGVSVLVSSRRQPVRIREDRRLEIGVPVLADAAAAAFYLRCGAELIAWREAAAGPAQEVAAALLGFHTCLKHLETTTPAERARVLAAGPQWLTLAFDRIEGLRSRGSPPSALAESLAEFLPHLTGIGALIPANAPGEIGNALERVAQALGIAQPTEMLLTLGGDDRLLVSPETGLNRYGCSPRPRPWAITFSTCTASSISDPAYARAERQRRRLFAPALSGRLVEGFAEATRELRKKVARVLCLERVPGADVLLTPSGTDAELFAIHCVTVNSKRPLLNILVAPREIGSGGRHAAAGRHFDRTSPLGGPVTPGSPVEGLRCDHIRVCELELRNETGCALPDRTVEVNLRQAVEEGIARGESVAIHLLDSSKTGLGAPTINVVEQLRLDFGERIAVIVDAAQMRVSRTNLAKYLQRGFYVIATGSKFFTGPPFAGALLVPPAAAKRMESAPPFPRGLSLYASRWDIPEQWQGAGVKLADSPNYGLLLRWRAALWEMQAFFAADPAVRAAVFHEFGMALRDRMEQCASVELLPANVYRRPAGESWDSIPTIFSFLVHGRQGPLSYDDAVMAYHWLNADLSGRLPPNVAERDRRLAAQCCHVGQPVRVRREHGVWIGALRIAPGARLVSRVCFDPGIGKNRQERLAQQVDAAGVVLDKVDMICRYWDDLVAEWRPAQPIPATAANTGLGESPCR